MRYIFVAAALMTVMLLLYLVAVPNTTLMIDVAQ